MDGDFQKAKAQKLRDLQKLFIYKDKILKRDI